MNQTQYFDPHKTTVKQTIPYDFKMDSGKVVIKNLRGQVLYVSIHEILRQLQRPDLDIASRRKYEGARVFYQNNYPETCCCINPAQHDPYCPMAKERKQ